MKANARALSGTHGYAAHVKILYNQGGGSEQSDECVFLRPCTMREAGAEVGIKCIMEVTTSIAFILAGR